MIMISPLFISIFLLLLHFPLPTHMLQAAHVQLCKKHYSANYFKHVTRNFKGILSEGKLFCFIILIIFLEPCILEQKSYQSVTVGIVLLLVYHIQKYYFSNIPSMSYSLIVIQLCVGTSSLKEVGTLKQTEYFSFKIVVVSSH